MELKNGIKTTMASSQDEWRKWLEINHKTEQSILLIMFKKESGKHSVITQKLLMKLCVLAGLTANQTKEMKKVFISFFQNETPKAIGVM